MFEFLLNNPVIKSLKYYIVFIVACLCFFAYGSVIGWKYNGYKSEKWAPEGHQQHYHK